MTRKASGVLLVLGGMLLVGLIAWIATTPGPRQQPLVLTGGAAFEGNLQLPKETIDREITGAATRMEHRYQSSERFRIAADILQWLSFLCTALITLLAGYFGVTIPTAGNVDVAALQQGRSVRFARTVGVIAALAAVCTGAGSRATTSSEHSYQQATEMRTTITTVRKNVYEAKDASTAQQALDILASVR